MKQNSKRRVKLSLFGWVEAIIFAVMLLIFISGEAGWVMVYVIAGAVSASLSVCIVSRRRFTVECGGFSGLYRKGDAVTAELTFRARGFCVLPFITVNGTFMGRPFTARCSLIGRSGSVRITMTAAECCLNRLEIHEIQLRDFLGLITFWSDERPNDCVAAVLPDIVDYVGPEVLPSVLPSDSDEETESGTLTGGSPGYEHRGYEPGDPLNRINYKLSAKKRALMVRRDENTPAEYTDIVIAPGADGGCAEKALALTTRLISLGGAARVICGRDSLAAASPAAADRLREWLAFRDLGSESLAEPQRSASLSHTVVTISKEGVTVS